MTLNHISADYSWLRWAILDYALWSNMLARSLTFGPPSDIILNHMLCHSWLKWAILGHTWLNLTTWLNTLARSLTCGPPSNRPHAFLRQTRNGLGFIKNQEHVFYNQIESKVYKNCVLILYACFVQCSLAFLCFEYCN